MQHDRIAVIDFGGQYAHLIATKVRRLEVYAEIHQPEDPEEAYEGCRGIILSGSPSLASQGEDSGYNKGIYELPIPILGFCFGHQEIAKHYGGEVIHGKQEWGHADLRVRGNSPIFKGLGPVEPVFMSHFDSVASVGPGFEELGYSSLGNGPEHRFAAIGSDKFKRWGFQFHPEVDDTVHGDQMIRNFVFEICRCKPSWTMEAYMEEQLADMRSRIGERSVFLLASGGVDSTVAAVLLARAIGPERLSLLHIDNGLMRKNESQKVMDSFEKLGLASSIHFSDASEVFLEALAGATEPERKRRIIGETFVRVFDDEARSLGLEDHLLGQGTIYPDTIETGGTRRADVIKTHHNRVPLIEELIAEGKVIEPLKDLYKVEVRELGETLGIPREMLYRHPFPGPGLGVRLLCSKGAADFEPTPNDRKHADAVSALAAAHGVDAHILPVRSVGVKADLRSYEHPVLFSGRADWPNLLELAGQVLKQVPGVNRCLWNLGPGTPESLRPLAATVTRERLDLLREADAIMMDALRNSGLYAEIWQCPTVLVPLEINGEGRELCILRPIRSERAMTARPAELPADLLSVVAAKILDLPGISGVAFDLTSKPPGTIEWE